MSMVGHTEICSWLSTYYACDIRMCGHDARSTRNIDVDYDMTHIIHVRATTKSRLVGAVLAEETKSETAVNDEFENPSDRYFEGTNIRCPF